MINIANWEWPQYVIVTWWVVWAIASVILRASGAEFPNRQRRHIAEWIGGRMYVWGGQAVMFLIMMAGGFWA